MIKNRFFIETLKENSEQYQIGSEFEIRDTELLHQWRNVLRFKTGETILFYFNTPNEYLARINELNRESARCEILEINPNPYSQEILSSKNICLIVSVLKKDKAEWVAQKATEIGVSQIVFVSTERSEKKNLDEKRIHRIIKEACEQSGRSILPHIEFYTQLNEIMIKKLLNNNEIVSFLDTFDRNSVDNEINIQQIKSAALLVGPEGGWTDSEKNLFLSLGVKRFNLGPQILRAETAAIATVSLFLLNRKL